MSSNSEPEQQFNTQTTEEICEMLTSFAENGKKLLIISHINPDGDTIGSAFALKLIYNSLGGEAKCTCAAEGAPYLHFLYSGQTTIEYKSGEIDKYDVVCTVDTASPKQLGRMAELCSRIDFMIDHHGSGTLYADNLVVPSASATGEIIFDIYDMLCKNERITQNAEIAMRLYSAISSDTGSFMYSNTTAKTHTIAASLLPQINKDGFSPDTANIAHKLHQSVTMSDLTARKVGIENLRFTAGGKLAYIIITAGMLEENGLCEMDIGGIVDLPRSVQGVLVGVSVKQSRSDAKSFRVSSRSNCDIDVSKVCEKFGGGGHVRAAGASVYAESPIDAEKTVIGEFEAAVREYEKNNSDER